jgi:hypothetical protein
VCLFLQLGVPLSNTLAYRAKALITVQKSFVTLATDLQTPVTREAAELGFQERTRHTGTSDASRHVRVKPKRF